MLHSSSHTVSVRSKLGHGKWLRDLPTSYTADWLGENMLVRHGLNVILGAPKARKSTLRRYMASAVLAGAPIFGLYPTKQVGKVLVLIGESIPEIESAAHHQACASLGLADYGERVWVEKPAMGFDLTSMPDLTDLIDFVREQRFELVFFDPLVNFHNADENDAKGMGKVCRNLLKICEHTTVCVVHHTAKPSEADASKTVGQRGRGSSVIAGAADTTLLLARRGASEANMLFFETRHAAEPEPFQIYYDSDSGLWIPYADRPPLLNKVSEYLSSHPDASTDEVCKAIKARRKNVLEAIREVRGEVPGSDA